jgi:hypothetical protein
MQVNSNTVINTQTITPFTSEQRVFNMKESNSTGNCITGNCNNIQLAKQISQKDISNIFNTVKNFKEREETLTNKFLKQMEEFPNSTPKDYTYNSKEDFRAPTFNQWTRSFDDNCSEQTRLRIASKPMKYFVNEFNSPQAFPLFKYTVIGNQKQYDVRNDYERPIPTRLNPIYDVPILPYPTSPFLGNASDERVYIDTSSVLRNGTSDIRLSKSQVGLTEREFNRWDVVDPYIVQNAGQFGGKIQQPIGSDGYYDYKEQNNILFMNSAVPPNGISSRNLLHNVVNLSGC